MIDIVRRHLPVKYRELAKFLVVGGTSYIVDVGLFTLMSHTVLESKVVTAKAISILVATVLSYILNREWSFSRRGGREKHHEAMLFFLVNGIALGLNLVPLALSQYVFGINTTNYSSFTVTIANFISANVIGTILGMAFRFWAYRKWVFPEELTPHPELLDEALALAAMQERAEAEAVADKRDRTNPTDTGERRRSTDQPVTPP
jgi:putative flippase GtrA